MRTVALLDQPDVHLKVPLPTATLGRRNRRTIRRGTLADGALVQSLLAGVLRAEPRLAARVLLADESRWIESDHEDLAVLLRQYPAAAARDRLVPLAALLADDPWRPGRRLLDAVAGEDVPGWLDRYFEVLFDWHTALLLRYGIALEAHQQNITVAIGGGLRLIYKDNDGARIAGDRWPALRGELLGPRERADFDDARMTVAGVDDLVDLFITMTVHLGTGAVVFGTARGDRACAAALLRLARHRLLESVERWREPASSWSRTAADALVRRLDAARWPVKAMVTAGTLLPKHRLGVTDVNKHVRTSGPNYLRPAGAGSCRGGIDDR
jgi:siderophore synthetase component